MFISIPLPVENLILYSYLRIFYLVVGYGHNNHFQFPSERSFSWSNAQPDNNAVAMGSEVQRFLIRSTAGGICMTCCYLLVTILQFELDAFNLRVVLSSSWVRLSSANRALVGGYQVFLLLPSFTHGRTPTYTVSIRQGCLDLCPGVCGNKSCNTS